MGYTPVIPAIWRLRQEELYEFEASLGYIARQYLKNKKNANLWETTYLLPQKT
jgi:hypothetical protein